MEKYRNPANERFLYKHYQYEGSGQQGRVETKELEEHYEAEGKWLGLE